MSTKHGRPVRPSASREATAAREAAKLERDQARLVIETCAEVLRGTKIRAAMLGVPMRTYVLRLLAADGVEAAQHELERPAK